MHWRVAGVAAALVTFCRCMSAAAAAAAGNDFDDSTTMAPALKVSVVIDSYYLSNGMAPTVTAKAERAFASVLESLSSQLNNAQLTVILDISQISSKSSYDADKLVNPLRITSQELCACIINGSVTIVYVHPPFFNKHLSSTISYSLGFYRVPIISISSRDIEFSDKVNLRFRFVLSRVYPFG
ncbi:unnamed protein product [Soboliphyme baturini]|uniref:Secreted protein n=1 Tax=Soboliphyme baturini TaxID=241478 RepID=A0A183IU45_9BILA|nr:unnamed protein product [Soboliphyme baturini]